MKKRSLSSTSIHHYDVREIAKGYVNVASVLAGFSFTSIVLILDKQPNGELAFSQLKDQAAISFLVGFFGCVISAFIYAVLSGEKQGASPRAYSMLLICGGVFSLSASFLFWGLIPLIRIYTNSEIVEISRWIYYIIIIFILLNFIISVIDLRGSKNTGRFKYYKLVSTKQYLFIFTSAYLPLLAAIATKTYYPSLLYGFAACFNITIAGALSLIALGATFSALVANFQDRYEIPFYQSVIWIFLHSTVFGFLTIVLP